MSEEQTVLESRVAALEKDNRDFFKWGWIIVVAFNALAFMKVVHSYLIRIPSLEKTFSEILAGEPLPSVTQFALKYGWGVVSTAAVLLIVIVLWGRKRSKAHLPQCLAMGVTAWLIQMLFLMIAYNAQVAPMVRLMERL